VTNRAQHDKLALSITDVNIVHHKTYSVTGPPKGLSPHQFIPWSAKLHNPIHLHIYILHHITVNWLQYGIIALQSHLESYAHISALHQKGSENGDMERLRQPHIPIFGLLFDFPLDCCPRQAGIMTPCVSTVPPATPVRSAELTTKPGVPLEGQVS